MHAVTIKHTREFLLDVKESVKSCVSIQPWKRTTDDLTLFRRPTRRWTKAGIKFRRCIPVLINRDCAKRNNIINEGKQSGINFNNLIQLPTGFKETYHSDMQYEIQTVIKPRLLNHVRTIKTHRNNLHVIQKDHILNNQHTKPLIVYLQNVRSISNKAISVSDFVVSNDIDILALTETWLGNVTDSFVIGNLVPTGYEFEHVPRSTGKTGGGVGVLFKSGLSLKINTSTKDNLYTHFEHMDCCISTGELQFAFSVIYRPPPSSKNGFKNSICFDEWALLSRKYYCHEDRVTIVGDLSFHLDNPNDVDSQKFSRLLNVHGLKQHVVGAGHTLDVVITREHTVTYFMVRHPLLTHVSVIWMEI